MHQEIPSTILLKCTVYATNISSADQQFTKRKWKYIMNYRLYTRHSNMFTLAMHQVPINPPHVSETIRTKNFHLF